MMVFDHMSEWGGTVEARPNVQPNICLQASASATQPQDRPTCVEAPSTPPQHTFYLKCMECHWQSSMVQLIQHGCLPEPYLCALSLQIASAQAQGDRAPHISTFNIILQKHNFSAPYPGCKSIHGSSCLQESLILTSDPKLLASFLQIAGLSAHPPASAPWGLSAVRATSACAMTARCLAAARAAKAQGAPPPPLSWGTLRRFWHYAHI